MSSSSGGIHRDEKHPKAFKLVIKCSRVSASFIISMDCIALHCGVKSELSGRDWTMEMAQSRRLSVSLSTYAPSTLWLSRNDLPFLVGGIQTLLVL